MSKLYRQISFVITGLLLIVILTPTILIAAAGLFGFKAYAVDSGSMEPSIQTGSLILVRKMPPENIRPDDIVTFDTKNKNDKSFTHRIVSIDNKNRQFITRGDANNSNDTEPASFDNAVGRVEVNIPYLGYYSIIFKSTPGYIFCAIILLIFASFELELIFKKERSRSDGITP